jgi:hypothetical protein
VIIATVVLGAIVGLYMHFKKKRGHENNALVKNDGHNHDICDEDDHT